jgi:hypothetical protein
MAECLRCGCAMKDDTAQQRAKRGRDMWGCKECQAGKQTKLTTDYGICEPHQLELDDDNRPLTRLGELYRPGVRLCGYSDCINLDHIESVITDAVTKECSRCNQPKPLEAFGIDRKKRDGLNCECRICRVGRG